ncbi:hypothetical protein KY361_05210 [Candidatus Woesearchaeota archaeon]|nr:hypothetical protein [Candidatus Woesearchaeota archaeon]
MADPIKNPECFEVYRVRSYTPGDQKGLLVVDNGYAALEIAMVLPEDELARSGGQEAFEAQIGNFSFFEPTETYAKELNKRATEEEDAPFPIGLTNGSRVISLERRAELYGAKPSKGHFADFKEEKEFRRVYRGSDSRVNNWGDCYEPQNGFNPIDKGIVELIRRLNKIPFLYTKGESCSGIPADHKGEYVACVKDFGIGEQEMGYVQLRIDTTDLRYSAFKRGLELIADVDLVETTYKDKDAPLQRQSGVKYMAIRILVPAHILENPGSDEWKTFMPDKWNGVMQIVNLFYEGTVNERLLDQEIRSTRRRKEKELAENLRIKRNLKGK